MYQYYDLKALLAKLKAGSYTTLIKSRFLQYTIIIYKAYLQVEKYS